MDKDLVMYIPFSFSLIQRWRTLLRSLLEHILYSFRQFSIGKSGWWSCIFLCILYGCEEQMSMIASEALQGGDSIDGRNGGEMTGGRLVSLDQGDIAGSNQVDDLGEGGESMAGGDVNGGGVIGGTEGGMNGGEVHNEEMTGGTVGDMLDSLQWTPAQIECGSRRTRPPLVALTFPLVDQIGEVGTEVSFYEWSSQGLSLWSRLDVGFRPDDILLLHDGQWAVVVGQEGEICTVDLRGDQPQVQTQLTLPSSSYKGIYPYPHSLRLLYTVAFNSTIDSGASLLEIGCEGELTEYTDQDRLSLRLTFGIAPLNQRPDLVVAFGGQAVFDPIDPLDLRVYQFTPISEGGLGWQNIASFDLWQDFIDAEGVAVSPSGDEVIMVNSSPFSDEGNQVRIARLTVPLLEGEEWGIETTQIIESIQDPQRAVFDPEFEKVWISQAEAGSLFYLEKDQNGQWREGGRFSQLGLADHFTFSQVWSSADQGSFDMSSSSNKEEYWLWLPYTRPSGGSLIRRIIKDSNGIRTLEGVNDFYLGEGANLLPDAIDVWPK